MLKRKLIYVCVSVLMVSVSVFCMNTISENEIRSPQKLRIGTTISVFGGLQGLTYENLKEARSAGISDIEISLTGLVNGNHPIPNAELKEKFRQIKQYADSAESISGRYICLMEPTVTRLTLTKPSVHVQKMPIVAILMLSVYWSRK